MHTPSKIKNCIRTAIKRQTSKLKFQETKKKAVRKGNTPKNNKKKLRNNKAVENIKNRYVTV